MSEEGSGWHGESLRHRDAKVNGSSPTNASIKNPIYARNVKKLTEETKTRKKIWLSKVISNRNDHPLSSLHRTKAGTISVSYREGEDYEISHVIIINPNGDMSSVKKRLNGLVKNKKEILIEDDIYSLDTIHLDPHYGEAGASIKLKRVVRNAYRKTAVVDGVEVMVPDFKERKSEYIDRFPWGEW